VETTFRSISQKRAHTVILPLTDFSCSEIISELHHDTHLFKGKF